MRLRLCASVLVNVILKINININRICRSWFEGRGSRIQLGRCAWFVRDSSLLKRFEDERNPMAGISIIWNRRDNAYVFDGVLACLRTRVCVGIEFTDWGTALVVFEIGLRCGYARSNVQQGFLCVSTHLLAQTVSLGRGQTFSISAAVVVKAFFHPMTMGIKRCTVRSSKQIARCKSPMLWSGVLSRFFIHLLLHSDIN